MWTYCGRKPTAWEWDLATATGPSQAPQIFTIDQGSQELVAADLNGDGFTDVATCNFGTTGESMSVLIGRGDGTFHPFVNYRAGYDSCCLGVGNIIAGDVDRDGDTDLMISNQGNGDVSVFRNNGNGTFQRHVRYGVGFTSPDVRFGDFSGDGIGDLAVIAGTPPLNLSRELIIVRGTTTEPTVYCTAKSGLVCGTPAIAAAGRPSASQTSGFILSAGPARGSKSGLLIYSDAGRTAMPFLGEPCVWPPNPCVEVWSRIRAGSAASATVSSCWT